MSPESGFDVEVFSFADLENAWRHAKLESEREHVTPYIRKSCSKNETLYYLNDVRLQKLDLSVDRLNQLKLVREIYKIADELKLGPYFGYEDVLKILDENPHLLKYNDPNRINEGYAKSLREDKVVK